MESVMNGSRTGVNQTGINESNRSSGELLDVLPLARGFIIFEYIFVALVLGIGLPANALVIKVITQNHIQSATDRLLLVISITDLLLLVANSITFLFAIDTRIVTGLELLVLCKLRYYVFGVGNYVSMFLLASVGMDRYKKTFSADASSLRKRHVTVIVTGSVLISCMLSAPQIPLAGRTAQFTCHPFALQDLLVSRLAAMPRLVITALFGIFVVSIYGRMIWSMRRRMEDGRRHVARARSRIPDDTNCTIQSVRSLQQERRRWKISRLVMCLTVLYLVANVLPTILPAIVRAFSGPYTDSYSVYIVYNFSLIGNACNPVCFLAMSSKFRADFLENVTFKFFRLPNLGL